MPLVAPVQIEAIADTALVALRKQLADTPSHSLAILVDPALADPLAQALEEASLQPIRISISTAQVARDKLPYLVWIDDETKYERVVSASIRLAVEERLAPEGSAPRGTRSLCAWFITPALTSENQARALALTLATHGIQHSPDGQRHYFRFFDPRIAIDLPALLSPEQWQQFVGNIGLGWLLMNEEGSLQSLKPQPGSQSMGAAQDVQPGNHANPAKPFVLSPAQWQTLSCIGWRNRIAQALFDWGLAGTPTKEALHEIARRAIGYGLAQEDDILSFARLALTEHPLFDRHPEVNRVLQGLRSSADTNFTSIAETWDDDFWANIRAGSWLRDTLSTSHPKS